MSKLPHNPNSIKRLQAIKLIKRFPHAFFGVSPDISSRRLYSCAIEMPITPVDDRTARTTVPHRGKALFLPCLS